MHAGYHLKVCDYIFADGQKIAKKLAVQITKETKAIQALLPEYNACERAVGGEDGVSQLVLTEALDPNVLASVLRPQSSLPSKSKRELMDSYIMVKRSTEEVTMLETDMRNTIQYYFNQRATIEDLLKLFKGNVQLERGSISLLKNMYACVDRKLTGCTQLFENCTPVADPDDDTDSDTNSELEYSSDEC